ncbi:D-lyxose/D-mannose family sugar isomerase [Parafilimonas sp.]|uniref:D-lyxose/D-mannose family sugar isomerase n=1 Tax=Parafilimonas sp. TaxID=1969739 RepID=UPI0039E4C403
MKRSEMNRAIASAKNFFDQCGWVLPPAPEWDITDFGLGDFKTCGLVLVNLAEEAEYCEKIMYATRQQRTPAHCHKKKKEDIICRAGKLAIILWREDPAVQGKDDLIEVKINGQFQKLQSGAEIELAPGERITIPSHLWHEFFPVSDECMIGEVSTANDDVNDNFFSNPDIGRFSNVIED